MSISVIMTFILENLEFLRKNRFENLGNLEIWREKEHQAVMMMQCFTGWNLNDSPKYKLLVEFILYEYRRISFGKWIVKFCYTAGGIFLKPQSQKMVKSHNKTSENGHLVNINHCLLLLSPIGQCYLFHSLLFGNVAAST